MKNTYNDYLNGDCTLEDFKATLNLIKPELGKVYKQMAESWAIMHWKIIFQNDDISVGILVFDGIYNRAPKYNEYEMFRTKDGFKYDDIRYNYRLVEEIKK